MGHHGVPGHRGMDLAVTDTEQIEQWVVRIGDRCCVISQGHDFALVFQLPR